MKVIPLYKMIVKEETDVSLAKKGDHEAFISAYTYRKSEDVSNSKGDVT